LPAAATAAWYFLLNGDGNVDAAHHDAVIAGLDIETEEALQLCAARGTSSSHGPPGTDRAAAFMSHRTVGAHLYQIFPKLGITSRAAPRDALAGLPQPDKPGSSE
jgi:hypothetical protein